MVKRFFVAALILAPPFSWAVPAADETSGAIMASPSANSGRLYEGFWVWNEKYITDPAGQDVLLAFCGREGFNRLLIQLPWKKGTGRMVPSTGSAASLTLVPPEIDHPAELKRLLAEAARRHIAVEALDGGKKMGDKDHWLTSLASVDCLIAFNRTLPSGARFAGLHWDIEPVGRRQWKSPLTRVPIETDYLNLLLQAKERLHAAGLTLAADVPMWTDMKLGPEDPWIVTVDGKSENFHRHVQDLTDYETVMTYRRNALGENSAFANSSDDVAYARKIGKFVCAAFEAEPENDAPKITFYGLSGAELRSQQAQLENAYQGDSGFGGVFIDDFSGALPLFEPAAAPATKSPGN